MPCNSANKILDINHLHIDILSLLYQCKTYLQIVYPTRSSTDSGQVQCVIVAVNSSSQTSASGAGNSGLNTISLVFQLLFITLQSLWCWLVKICFEISLLFKLVTLSSSSLVYMWKQFFHTNLISIDTYMYIRATAIISPFLYVCNVSFLYNN